jgi:hypothetical protein
MKKRSHICFFFIYITEVSVGDRCACGVNCPENAVCDDGTCVCTGTYLASRGWLEISIYLLLFVPRPIQERLKEISIPKHLVASPFYGIFCNFPPTTNLLLLLVKLNLNRSCPHLPTPIKELGLV